jgi:thioredoxin-like negative regulator of GroEL
VSVTVSRPRLLFFLSSTSGQSRRAEGYLAQVLQHGHNHETFEILRIDVEQRPDLAQRLRVATVPALLVVEERRVRARLYSPTGATKIEAFLAPWLRQGSLDRGRPGTRAESMP